MSYQVMVRRVAQEQLDRLSAKDRDHLLDSILSLQEEPRPRNVTKLTGLDLWRVRVRQFRIRYHIDDKARKVIVVRVARRSEHAYGGL